MAPLRNAVRPRSTPLPVPAGLSPSELHELRPLSLPLALARPADSAITTTILISNLHCPSCSSTIESLLSCLSPAPLDISIGILEHRVTVTHLPELLPQDIIRVLLEAEFDIDSVSTVSNAERLTTGNSSENVIRFPGVTPDWLEEMQGRLQQAVAAGGKKRASRGQKHLQNCELCRSEKAFGVTQEKGAKYGDHASIPSRRSITGSATQTLVNQNLSPGPALYGYSEKSLAFQEEGRPDTRLGIEADHVPESSGDAERPYEALVSIGGMTCASCSNRITEVLEVLSWVQSISVNLMGNSATVTFDAGQIGGAENGAQKIVDEVEDSGFECSLETLRPLKAEGDVPVLAKGQMGVEREVALQVAGTYCDHCPQKIMEVMESSFPGQRLSIEAPFTRSSSIVRFKYTPEPPRFTLRHIAAAISAISPDFVVSVYRPPTMEQRSRQLQLRERNRLLMRLILCAVIAIPTFMVGILWMSLVGKENRIRMFLEQPMWGGSATRAVWALFFLSTPVMFCVADVFHKRALHEIWALWRKGSSVPILRRFYRFGSMNLLISLGVSISYFASVALLALNAVTKPPVMGGHDGIDNTGGMGGMGGMDGMGGVDGMGGMDGMGGVGGTGTGGVHEAPPKIHTTTYFDSAVFLTMFLLIGRFLEAYSKSKTAEAVNLLGGLRPSEALLIVKSDEEAIAADETSFKPAPSQSPIGENDPSNTEYSDNRPWKSLTIPSDLLEVGDIVGVVRGASPPADGTVISGRSQFDESSLTGEAKLVPKSTGDPVHAGTINEGQVVNVRVDCITGDSMLDQIVKIVREGQTRRAPIERLADVITGYFVPVVTFLAITTWLVWLSLGLSGALPASYLDTRQGGWAVWSLGFAIAVFVIACPCGIGLAAPTALFVGSGLAAKFGILAKGGGEAFQEASWLDCIVFDKTGTLTVGGEPKVMDEVIIAKDPQERKLAYAIARRLEEGSAHPLARALVAHCLEKDMVDVNVVETEEMPGRGLTGVFTLSSTGDVYEAIIGNERFMCENSVPTLSSSHANALNKWKSEGKSVILLAIRRGTDLPADGFGLAAMFAASDQIRPEAPEVVRKLREDGIAVWMISGDDPVTARAVAQEVGIDGENVVGGVLPHEKAEKIKYLQQIVPKRPRTYFSCRRHRLRLRRRREDTSGTRAIIAMVGDGINDAPALSTADLGIAIGSGSDIALSSAKFILVSSDLRSILTLTRLASAVVRRIKANFFWACIYNVVMVPVAAGVVYPVGRVRVAPEWAALAMAFR